MKTLTKTLLMSACGLAFMATTASAAIVCNSDGDCWHVKKRYVYKPDFGLVVHPDNWRWKKEHSHRYRWREHHGRGYWRKGVWLEF